MRGTPLGLLASTSYMAGADRCSTPSYSLLADGSLPRCVSGFLTVVPPYLRPLRCPILRYRIPPCLLASLSSYLLPRCQVHHRRALTHRISHLTIPLASASPHPASLPPCPLPASTSPLARYNPGSIQFKSPSQYRPHYQQGYVDRRARAGGYHVPLPPRTYIALNIRCANTHSRYWIGGRQGDTRRWCGARYSSSTTAAGSGETRGSGGGSTEGGST